MVTEELLDYVKNQRREGVSEQAIREALLSVGWVKEDADQALTLTASETSAVPNNPPDLEKSAEEVKQMEQPEVNPEETAQETPQGEQASQQEDYLASLKQSSQPAGQTPVEEKESALLEEKPIVENKPQDEALKTPEALPWQDAKPIELDSQGQVVRSSEGPSALEEKSPVEAQQDTEVPGGFKADVSSSQAEASPNISQEPASQQPAASAPAETSSGKQSSESQEQSSQVAVDPKAK